MSRYTIFANIANAGDQFTTVTVIDERDGKLVTHEAFKAVSIGQIADRIGSFLLATEDAELIMDKRGAAQWVIEALTKTHRVSVSSLTTAKVTLRG